MKPKIMILLGSGSDFNIAEKAIDVLETLRIPYDVKVASAHRTHKKVKKIVSESSKGSVNVFLGIAGLSAHLPGMIAANTHKPVVGVPVDVKLGGLDALFACAQMPFGAPVATVGIDRGENAALLASQIIGIHDQSVRKKISAMKAEFFHKIQEDEKKLLEKLEGSYYSHQWPDIQKNKLKNQFSNNKLDEHESNESNSVDVSVIVGSNSDIKVAKKTTWILNKMGISYDCIVISPIRYPERFENYLKRMKDVKLFIAVTGLSAHVTGAIVAYSEKPVIGVPCSIGLEGLDSLLSMVNMPPGVPVATLGIDNGGNAGLLAAKMLKIPEERITEDVLNFK